MTTRFWKGPETFFGSPVGVNYFNDVDWLNGLPVAGDTAIVNGSDSVNSVPGRYGPLLFTINSQTELVPIAFFDTSLVSALEADPANAAIPAATPVVGETIDFYGGSDLVQAVLVSSTFSASTTVNVTGNARFDNNYSNTLAGTIVVAPTSGGPVNDFGANGELDLVEHAGGSSDPKTLAATGYVPATTNTGLILVGSGSLLVVAVQGNSADGYTPADFLGYFPVGYNDGGISQANGYAAFVNNGAIGVNDGRMLLDTQVGAIKGGPNLFINNGLIGISVSSGHASLEASNASIEGTGRIALRGAGTTKATASFGGDVTNAVTLTDASVTFNNLSYLMPTTNSYAGGSLTFADNASTISVSDTVLYAGFLPISGFAPGDAIVVNSFDFQPNPFFSPTVKTVLTWQQTSSAGGTLTVGYDNGSFLSGPIGTFDLTGTYVQSQFSAISFPGAGLPGDPNFVEANTTITLAACYCRGTLIMMEQGEVAVEALAVGDMLVTASGALRPIRWIGHRAHAQRFAVRNRALWPVVIEAGALADAVPRRDLLVSPAHAMFLDEVLIPAGALVNGRTIRQAAPSGDVEYFHLELDDHDVIVAEGSLSESYVDDDNRGMFANAHTYAGGPAVLAEYCAPRLEAGMQVEAVRRRLAARALQAA